MRSLGDIRQNTQCISLTCIGEHIRKQLVEHSKVVMSIFNDTGGYEEFGEALAAGTYMVVLM
jgi:hypothetical protein